MSWTDDRVQVLRQLWGNGKSASEIAEILGGVTRNAVIGKAHRLGLSGRPSPIRGAAVKPRPLVKPALRVRPAPPRAEEERSAPPASRIEPPFAAAPLQAELDDAPPGGANILDLTERMCRWPHGDPRKPGFRFCGRSCMSGLPYCTEHAAKAYQAPKARREDSAAQIAKRTA